MPNVIEPYRFDPQQLPGPIRDKLVGTDVFPHGGVDYTYGLLDPSVAPIHYVVGMNGGQNLVASVEIPKGILLTTYLTHEILCNRVRAGEDGRCAATEQGLIESVTADDLRLVIGHRRRTFEDLLRIYGIDPESVHDPLHREIAGSAIYLRDMARRLGLPEEQL